MKKICIIFVLALLAGFVINCGQAPPPQDAFRLKTRVKFRLFGFIPLFAIPAPFQQINLKTNTMPGAPNTSGTVAEFDPNGAFVPTDHVGKYDARNAVLPATWTVKVNPNQPIEYPCMYPATMTFQAQAVKTYKYKCSIDIVNNFTATPNYIYVNASGVPSTGNDPINWGVNGKGSNDEAFFSNADNLKVRYYRLTGIDTTNGDYEEIYELESETDPQSISPDGTEIKVNYPGHPFGWRYSGSGYLVDNTTKRYHIVIVEDGTYIGHLQFEIGYPERCERTRQC